MKNNIVAFLLSIFILSHLAASSHAQKWNFIKEKDGIKVYTRESANSNVKSFRGEAVFHTTMDKLSAYVGTTKSFDWWADDIKDIRVLGYEKEKYIRYYLVYDVPWPLEDRDLCVESKISYDPKTGTRVVRADPLPNAVPEQKDKVRIKTYWQTWTMKPIDKNTVSVVLEGSVDPGGAIPAWLYNMVITDTPIKVIRSLRNFVETK